MSKYVQAQKLNRYWRIERKAGGKDAWGQPLDNWVLVRKAWMGVKTITGAGFVNQEFQAADRETSRTTASIRMRDGPNRPTAGMRIVGGGRIYEIRVVLPDTQDNRYLDIGVAEGANDG